ncbi:MAG: PorV/PorQ family protein [Ignavibacterium sp.]|uniref:PorV/PorQ family protein n=1 Tax=Ignavibacterium sp. TaxID=2651167 RepID=UPI00404B8DD1
MKNNNFITALLSVFFLISLSIQPAFAQNKSGTTIGQFLKIEPSSRTVALGNAGASLYGEVSSIFYNPASLGRLQGNDVQFTYNKWLADINYNYMAAAVKVEGIGTFSLIGTMLNSGEMDVRTVEQPLGTGERFSVKNFAFGLGYGMMLTDRVSLGIQINYITEMIWHSSLTTFGLNFGVQYQLMDERLTLGASVSNFGARASYDGRDLWLNYDINQKKYGDNDQLPAEFRTDAYPLPTIFRAGISYRINLAEDYSVLLAADAIHQNDNEQSISVGTELSLLKIFSLRAGFRNLFLPNLEGGLVLGGGIKKDFGGTYNIRFDYAYADYGRLAETHRVTVGLGF